MTIKLLKLFAVLFCLGLFGCKSGPRATVAFISDLKEETRDQAKDGSFIYSHFLNVAFVRLHNERKLKKSDSIAQLKLYHLSGFSKMVKNADDIPYRLFAGDSTERIYPQRDSALMVLMGVMVTISDLQGNNVVVANDVVVPGQPNVLKIPAVTKLPNLNEACVSLKEHLSSKVTTDKNTFYKNIDLFIVNKSGALKKDQKYQLRFKVYDKLDPNRYFEGATRIVAYE